MDCIKLWGAPGTGKTTELIRRINNLIGEEGYRQEDFVVTTFRRRMADELVSRLGWDLKIGGIVNTIHGACRGLAGIGKVVEEKDRVEFCKSVGLPYSPEKGGRGYDQEPRLFGGSAKLGNLFFDARSFLINNLLDYSRIFAYHEADRLANTVPDPESFMRAFSKKYEEWKAEKELSDFDDMLKVVHDEQRVPGASVLALDESQDLTPLQYAIISTWGRGMDYVLMAGDPRQTIYQWWGASSEFFEKHPGKFEYLPISYRLPKNIWDYARLVLGKADLSAPDITTVKGVGVLRRIKSVEYYSMLPRFKESTYHLVRINEMGRPIAMALAHAGIPFVGIYGWGDKQISLYNAIIKVRQNLAGLDAPLTKSEVRAIINVYPAKYFALRKTEMREAIKSEVDLSFNDVYGFAALDIFGHRKLWDTIKSNYPLQEALGELGKPQTLSRVKIQAALENHRELITTPSVVVSTIHGVKGGEANYIFLHDSLTRKIYTKLYTEYNPDTKKGEAQVFYVGVTRAKQALFLVDDGSEYPYHLPDVPEVGG